MSINKWLVVPFAILIIVVAAGLLVTSNTNGENANPVLPTLAVLDASDLAPSDDASEVVLTGDFATEEADADSFVTEEADADNFATEEADADSFATEEADADSFATEDADADSFAAESAQPQDTTRTFTVQGQPGVVFTRTEFDLVVSYTVEDVVPEAVPDLPAGQKWVVVVATLSNDSDAMLRTTSDSWVLVDINNNRYTPAAPDAHTQPPLIGTPLESGESLLGLIRFAIPDDAQPQKLELCPAANCTQPLEALIS